MSLKETSGKDADLLQLDERTVGRLYETGEKSPWEGIWFKTATISG